MCYKRGNPSSTNTSGACSGSSCTIKITIVDGLYGRSLTYNSVTNVFTYSGGFSYACVGLTVTLTQGMSVLTAVTDATGTATFTTALPVTTGTLSSPAPTGRYNAISQAVGSYAVGSTTSFNYTISTVTGYFRHRGLSAVYGAVSNSMKLVYSGITDGGSIYEPGSGTATLTKSYGDSLGPYGLTNAPGFDRTRVCNDLESWGKSINSATGAGYASDGNTGQPGDGTRGWGLGYFEPGPIDEVQGYGSVSSGPPWVIAGAWYDYITSTTGSWTLSDITTP